MQAARRQARPSRPNRLQLRRLPAALGRLLARPPLREDRNVRRLLIFTALFGVVNGGVINFLPVLLIRLGATSVTVSLLTSLPALVTIGFALPAGFIVSRWRDMSRLSGRCFFLLRLAYVPIAGAMLLDPRIAPYLIVGIWALTAIPGTLGNTAFYDIVTAAVQPQRRARVNGLRWALLGMVSAVSVSLFGQMLERLTWPANYLLLFGICFAAGITSTAIYSRIEMPLREPPPSAYQRLPWRARLAQLIQPLRAKTGFAPFALITFVMRVGLFLPAGLVSVFLVRELGVSEAWIGMRTTVEQGALTLGYYFWGRALSRLGQRRMLAIAMVAIAVAQAVLGQTTSDALWVALAAALLGGFFGSALDVSLFEWLLEVMPPADRPHYVAMNTLLMNVVAFGAPIAGASLAAHIGIPMVLRLAAAFALCTALLIALMSWRRRRRFETA